MERTPRRSRPTPYTVPIRSGRRTARVRRAVLPTGPQARRGAQTDPVRLPPPAPRRARTVGGLAPAERRRNVGDRPDDVTELDWIGRTETGLAARARRHAHIPDEADYEVKVTRPRPDLPTEPVRFQLSGRPFSMLDAGVTYHEDQDEDPVWGSFHIDTQYRDENDAKTRGMPGAFARGALQAIQDAGHETKVGEVELMAVPADWWGGAFTPEQRLARLRDHYGRQFGVTMDPGVVGRWGGMRGPLGAVLDRRPGRDRAGPLAEGEAAGRRQFAPPLDPNAWWRNPVPGYLRVINEAHSEL